MPIHYHIGEKGMKGLTACSSRHGTRKRVHNQTENGPEQGHNVRRKTPLAQPEGSMMDVVAATVPKTEDRDGVGNVQQRDAGRHHTVERSRGSQIQQTENTDDEAAHAVRDEGHIEGEVDPRDPLVTRHSAVTRERPYQTRLPGVAGDQASHSSDQEQSLQDNRTGLVVQGLVVKLQNRNLGGRVDEFVQVLQAEEHGNAVEPGGGETNGNRGQDGNRDVPLWLRHLFRFILSGWCSQRRPV